MLCRYHLLNQEQAWCLTWNLDGSLRSNAVILQFLFILILLTIFFIITNLPYIPPSKTFNIMILLCIKEKDSKIVNKCTKSTQISFCLMANSHINFIFKKTLMEENINMKEFLNKFLALELDESVWIKKLLRISRAWILNVKR